jgi:tRNA(fMet)-specific endonuclease VapC
MPFMLDTNVLIHLRDGDPHILARVAELDSAVLMSIVSRVELEGGVYRELDNVRLRRARLDAIVEAIPAVAFDDESADAYANIVAATGYSRKTLLDRMIAAQAIVHRATLVTRNRGDFTDIPGLEMVVW